MDISKNFKNTQCYNPKENALCFKVHVFPEDEIQ